MLKVSARVMVLLLIVAALVTSCAPKEPEIVEVVVTEEVEVEVTRIVEVEVEVEVTPEPTEAPEYFTETALQNIPLVGALADRHAEISGMAWYGDYLILLPQYPNFYLEEGTEEDGSIFAIAKADLDTYLNGESYAPLEAVQIPFDSGDAYAIEGFEGFESILFDGDTVYMTIEVSGADGMYANLVAGTIAPDLSSLAINTENMPQMMSQSGVENMSDETMILVDGNLVTFHEANGAAVNAEAVGHVFGADLSEAGTVDLQNINYRVTDATVLDENNNFWVINYFFPGEEVLGAEVDPIFEAFGKGPTHAASAGVERLIELNYGVDGVTVTNTPPIMLQLMADGNLRNLEGIVRYEGGFLVATDKYPYTILGYVPLPVEEE